MGASRDSFVSGSRLLVDRMDSTESAAHPAITEILEYREKKPRDWRIEGEEFEFVELKDGIANSVQSRKFERNLKSGTHGSAGGDSHQGVISNTFPVPV